MVEQTLTVRLPTSVIAKLKRAAALTHRSVDEIVATTVDAVLVESPSVPEELAAEFAAMHLLTDQALWANAKPSISPAEIHRLRQLNHAAGERSLTDAETSEQAALLAAYHVSVLRRAQALAILAQRGHHIPFQTSLETGVNDELLDT
jgi:hypothetical protein